MQAPASKFISGPDTARVDANQGFTFFGSATDKARGTFSSTKTKFKECIQKVLKTNNSYEIDEAALPAYAHKNLLIDFIFWRRVEIAFKLASKNTSARVLDFGCGSGLLSYALA